VLIGRLVGLSSGVLVCLLMAGVAWAGSGDERDRARWQAQPARTAEPRAHQPLTSGAVRNGSIFVEQWNEIGEYEFTLWRGGVDVPFRQLRGVDFASPPCISPDGSRLAYVLDERPEIVVRPISRTQDRIGPARVIGRLPRRLGDLYADCAWSPGGSAIALAGYASGRGVVTVWRIQADGSGLRELLRLKNAGEGNAPGDPAWSRTGRIAFVNTAAQRAWIAMVDADGTNPSRLPWGHSPAWSADGRQLAFIGSISNDYAAISPGPVIMANADGQDRRRFHRTRSSAVAFSPDGNGMAITRWVFPDQGSMYNKITITDTAGSTKRTLRMPASLAVSTGITWTRANGH
jgi:Tol biopolymer transport system component